MTTKRNLRTIPASSSQTSAESTLEAALIKRACRRDYGAFEELVQRHRSRLYALALHALQEPRAAEQALQATFVVAWERLPGYHGQVPLSSWLAGLCVGQVMQFLQRPGVTAAARPAHLRLLTPTERRATTSGEDHASPQETRLRLAIASTVASLPVDRRVSFVLGELGGASEGDIASALGVEPPIVKRHIHEALLSVLETIEAYGRAS
jgi:RNA polymerase sigma-70 factor (ECF subfamily)